MTAPAALVAAAWRSFICRACGLVYDEAKGDPDSGIAPGTRFDDIPDDWCCPLCGVTKADFEPHDPTPLPRRTSTGVASSPVAAGRAIGNPRREAGIVIVGAGTAGWQMAEALRALDADSAVTIVTACAGDVYDKPLLSVAFAKGLSPDTLVKERAADAARRLNVRLMPNTHAISISAAASSLRTTRGTLRYRHLVLAHGAAPREAASLPATLCWRINHLDAYRALRDRLGAHHLGSALSPLPRVVIAGAGLVGCEIANDLSAAGYPVTLLDVNTLPLASLLEEAASQVLLAAWQSLPLRFVGGVRISGVTACGAVKTVHTDDGRHFDADHVIAATGLETPSRLALSAGLDWQHGISVDPQTLRTSVTNIHALGDCISIDGRPMRYIEPIGRQARIIAASVTNQPLEPYDRRPPPIRIKTRSKAFTIVPAGLATQ